VKLSLNTSGLPLQDLVFGASVYFPPLFKAVLLGFLSGCFYIASCVTGCMRATSGIPADGSLPVRALGLSGPGVTDCLVIFLL
jgi:hypothetical protein